MQNKCQSSLAKPRTGQDKYRELHCNKTPQINYNIEILKRTFRHIASDFSLGWKPDIKHPLKYTLRVYVPVKQLCHLGHLRVSEILLKQPNNNAILKRVAK